MGDGDDSPNHDISGSWEGLGPSGTTEEGARPLLTVPHNRQGLGIPPSPVGMGVSVCAWVRAGGGGSGC